MKVRRSRFSRLLGAALAILRALTRRFWPGFQPVLKPDRHQHLQTETHCLTTVTRTGARLNSSTATQDAHHRPTTDLTPYLPPVSSSLPPVSSSSLTFPPPLSRSFLSHLPPPPDERDKPQPARFPNPPAIFLFGSSAGAAGRARAGQPPSIKAAIFFSPASAWARKAFSSGVSLAWRWVMRPKGMPGRVGKLSRPVRRCGSAAG